MRALLPVILAAAALTAAGCGTSATGANTGDKAFASRFNQSKQRLATLSARIDANEIESEADLDRALRDMRAAADEIDSLGGTLRRLDPPASARDELDDYVTQLATTSGLMRELASAVEDGDEKEAQTTLTAYERATIGLTEVEQAVNDALEDELR